MCPLSWRAVWFGADGVWGMGAQDYEYSGYNPIAFDIANHFCEFAADYHSDSPHLLDYSRYPMLEERRRFCHAYLTAAGRGGAAGLSSGGRVRQ